jgi:hypothetical protein
VSVGAFGCGSADPLPPNPVPAPLSSYRIVGLAGNEAAGKSTVAQTFSALTDGWHMEMAYRPWQITRAVWALREEQERHPWKDEIDPRYERTPRQLVKALSEGCKRADEHVWLREVRRVIETLGPLKPFYIAGIRFRNEIEWITASGGLVLWVDTVPGPDTIVNYLHEGAADNMKILRGTLERWLPVIDAHFAKTKP